MVVKYRDMEREILGSGIDGGCADEETEMSQTLLQPGKLVNISSQKDSHVISLDDDDEVEEESRGFLPNGKALLAAAASSISSGANTVGAANAHLFRNRFTSAKTSARRLRKRVVFKNGDCNVVQANVAKRRRRYLADIFTTLVDIQWRWNLMVFALGFILSWLGFAIIWWLIGFTHGDLEHQEDAKWLPCVNKVHSFTSAFLFSIETQHTIGYGYRYLTEECPEAIFVMCMQSIVGVMIQAFMVGVVFAKLSRPKKRTQTLLFSRQAVISERDGRLTLMFRVGDMRKSHIIQTQIRAQLIRKRVTAEGELLQHHLYEVKVGYDAGESQILFIWPLTIVHIINESSPFYKISARDLHRESFEIVVVLEGCIESTGMTTQARSSYLPNEILWGHRFEQLVTYRKESGEYAVDYSRFNNTYEVETPLCSAYELDEWRKTGAESKYPPRRKTLIPLKALMVRSRSCDSMKKHLAQDGKSKKRKSSSPTPSSPPVITEAGL